MTMAIDKSIPKYTKQFRYTPVAMGSAGRVGTLRKRDNSLKTIDRSTSYSSLMPWGRLRTQLHPSASDLQLPEKGCQCLPGLSRCKPLKTHGRGAQWVSRICVAKSALQLIEELL